METHIVVYRCIKERIPYLGAYSTAWVTCKALQLQGIKPKLLGLTYNQSLPDYLFSGIYGHLKFYIVDYCMSIYDMYRLYNAFAKVTIIDYHSATKLQIEDILLRTPENDWLRYIDSGEECSAITAWEYWFPKYTPPLFLYYIRDYILGRNEFEDTEEVVYAYNALGVNFKTFDRFYRLGNIFVDLARNYGSKELNRSKHKVEEILETVEIGHVGGYDNIPYVRLYGIDYKYTDLIGKAIREKYPDARFTAVLQDEYTWRLYANKEKENVDVGSISRRFGGQGTRTDAEYIIYLSCRLLSKHLTELTNKLHLNTNKEHDEPAIKTLEEAIKAAGLQRS